MKSAPCRYDGGGAQQPAQALSDQRNSGSSRVERRCTLGQITDEGMGSNGQPAYVQVSSASAVPAYSTMSGPIQWLGEM